MLFPCFPLHSTGSSLHLPAPGQLASLWMQSVEMLIGDQLGGRERQGYSSTLPVGVKSLEQLLLILGTCFLQACPPWAGVRECVQHFSWGNTTSALSPCSRRCQQLAAEINLGVACHLLSCFSHPPSSPCFKLLCPLLAPDILPHHSLKKQIHQASAIRSHQQPESKQEAEPL